MVYICLIYQRKLLRQQNPKAEQALGKLLLRLVSVSVPMFYFSLKRISRTHVDITFSFQPKKQTLVLNDDDDDDNDDVLKLKERLAAYNLNSSPNQSASKCYIIIFQTIYYYLYTT